MWFYHEALIYRPATILFFVIDGVALIGMQALICLPKHDGSEHTGYTSTPCVMSLTLPRNERLVQETPIFMSRDQIHKPCQSIQLLAMPDECITSRRLPCPKPQRQWNPLCLTIWRRYNIMALEDVTLPSCNCLFWCHDMMYLFSDLRGGGQIFSWKFDCVLMIQ